MKCLSTHLLLAFFKNIFCQSRAKLIWRKAITDNFRQFSQKKTQIVEKCENFNKILINFKKKSIFVKLLARDSIFTKNWLKP